MKKKPILFFIFGVFIFITIAVGLVVLNKTEGKDVETSINTSQVTENNTTQDDNITKDEPIYATKLTINCARSITIQKNNKVELLSGYIKVEPSEAFSNLTYSILDENENPSTKLKFKNNVIESSETGKYIIKFSVPKNENAYLTDNILIIVTAENNSNFISLNKTNLIHNETYMLDDIFILPSYATDVCIKSDNLNFNNLTIKPFKTGEVEVEVTYSYQYVKYFNTFTLKVWPKTEYSINIINVQGNTINKVCNVGDVLVLNYEIKYGEKEHINQKITVETNESVINYEITAPLIKIKCVKKGSTRFKIICGEDTSVYLELLINFI